MALKVHAGCTLGSGPKVKFFPLGSGPKVKSLATVLWRQTRGLRQTEGCRGKFVEKNLGSRRNPF